MAKKGWMAEQMPAKPREAEDLLSQGVTIAVVSRRIGISDHSYYQEYGGIRVDQARRPKELEQENCRSKKLTAHLSLENAILKEASRGDF